MDIFEYLPQLIVAYDSDDKFANLIHVKKLIKIKIIIVHVVEELLSLEL